MGLFRRPFASVREMDEALVARWNAVVGPDDTVWHLGDVALDRRIGRVADLVAALNGTKHLVAGNNDGEAVRALPHWASVQDYRELTTEEGRLLVLCHYPLRSWNRQGRGAVDLHGHSHGRLAAPLPR